MLGPAFQTRAPDRTYVSRKIRRGGRHNSVTGISASPVRDLRAVPVSDFDLCAVRVFVDIAEVNQQVGTSPLAAFPSQNTTKSQLTLSRNIWIFSTTVTE